jgi:hypothetical protein
MSQPRHGLPVRAEASAAASSSPPYPENSSGVPSGSSGCARDRIQLVVFAYESGLVRPGWA